MKILFVSAVLPYPLHSGGQIRIYNLLKRLSKIHEIHLYSFIRNNEEKKFVSKLTFCKKVTTVLRGRVWQPKYLYKTLTTSYPLLWSSYHNAHMLSLLSDEIVKGAYDLIHIEPGYIWPSIPSAHRIPIVIAEHNVEHEVYMRYISGFGVSMLKPFLQFDVVKMKKWEARAWNAASAIIAVSQEDKKKIGAGYVVPNGIDLPAYPFMPKKHNTPLIFLYTGNFAWMENKDAADNIKKNYWPVIKKQFPDAELRIVGKGAPDGEVENIQDEISGADILLAPIRVGGGTKFKILEAMAMGLPVVTTSIGAQGLDSSNIWIADTPAEMDIPDMVHDTKKIKNARLQIEKEYNWDTIAEKLDSIWNSLS